MKKRHASISKKVLFAFIFFAGGVGIGAVLGYQPRTARDTLGRAQSACQAESDRTGFIRCVKSHIAPKLDTLGPKAFMDGLDDMSQFQFQDINRCHDVAHAIGQLGVRQTSDVSFCSSSLCGDGCYHGAMESLVASGQELTVAVSKLCLGIDEESLRSRWACFHGIGHGVGSVTGNLIKSFSVCDSLKTDDDRTNCGAGALMELYQSPSIDHAKVPIPGGDVRALCSGLPVFYQPLCFLQAGVLTYEESRDVAAALAACRSVPAASTRGCIGKLGAYWLNVSGNTVDRVISLCRTATAEEFSSCVYGAVEENIFSDASGIIARAVCAASDEAAVSCFRFMGEKAMEAYGIGGRQTVCERVDAQYRPACLGE